VYADDHNVAFQKGDSKTMVLMVLNNLGERAENYTVKMGAVGFEGGLQVTDVLSCRNATVDDRGGLDVQFIEGLPSVSCFNTSMN
jgi:alpha-amylase